jgi:hypothetical protein
MASASDLRATQEKNRADARSLRRAAQGRSAERSGSASADTTARRRFYEVADPSEADRLVDESSGRRTGGPLDQGPVANQPRPSRAHAVIADPQAVVTRGFDWPHGWRRAPLQRLEFLLSVSNIAHLHVRRLAAGVSETRSPSGDRQSSRDASRRSRSQCVAAIPVRFDRPAWYGDSGACPWFLSCPLKCGHAPSLASRADHHMVRQRARVKAIDYPPGRMVAILQGG